ncbi:hypothetical protein LG324_09315 [Phycicoccus jejuensis]|uniref:hypothetical protein n=1 Tax=Phycicoccus jejuensis TaxID=367299 RepID=UPI0004C3AD9B|nr:hypothetical protein [Phycicoccus jejuensis]
MTGPLGDDGWPTDDAVADDTRAEKALEARLAAHAAGLAAQEERTTETHKSALASAAAAQAAATAELKADDDDARALAAADRAADLASLQAFATSLTTLAVGAVDRARSGADTVQKASAAIVTIYTGILGFVFVASDNPLPTRGVLAPVFLGAAVVLSTAYLAYVDGREASTRGPEAVGGVEPKVLARVNATVAAASAISTRRSYALRASVVALGVGLVYIVLPFVDLGSARAATPSAVASLPAWPTPAVSSPVELGAVVYEAQVAEVAASRTSALEAASLPPDVDDSGVVALLFLAGLAAVVVVPAAWGRPTST